MADTTHSESRSGTGFDPRLKADIDLLSIDTIRTLTIDAVEKAKSGHAGLPLGMAPVGYTLWTRFLRYDPADPHNPMLDSKGRVWMTSKLRGNADPAWCSDPTNKFANWFPLRSSGRQASYYDPKTKQFTLIDTLYDEMLTHHGLTIGRRHARKHLAWALDSAAASAGVSSDVLKSHRARVLTADEPAQARRLLADAYDAFAWKAAA